MVIKYGKQIELELIENIDIDLFLFANNFEERKLSAYTGIVKHTKIIKTIALCYIQDEVKAVENIEYALVENHNSIIEILNKEFLGTVKEEFVVFVDYSCMTKSWYYSIILYLANKELSLRTIKCYFSYTPSKYSEPLKPKPNTEISPLPNKYNVSNNKPKALIVGLGYEENKAQGIIDQLDPAITFLFYTDPAIEERFVSSVKENNASILEYYSDNTIAYPFNDLLFLERELTYLYNRLKEKYNIIIAPLGPKPFTFVSMMMSIVHPEIEIWRVGSGSDINEYPREAFDQKSFIVSEVIFDNVK
jgi:hypothetical protein